MSRDYWDARFRRLGRFWGDEPSRDGRRAAELCHSVRAARESPRRPISVLLLGCGYGRNAGCLAERDTRVVVVDSSPAALALAAPHPGVTYVGADAAALPFRTAGFDAVIALSLLHLLDAQKRRLLVGECSRMCRSGAILAVSVFAVGDSDQGRGDCVEPGTWQREDGKRTHFYTRDELREELQPFTVRELESGEEADSSGLRRYLWLTATAP